MDIFQTHVSVYNGVTDNTGTIMPLGTFLFCKEYKDDILRLRAVFDKEKRNALKRGLHRLLLVASSLQQEQRTIFLNTQD